MREIWKKWWKQILTGVILSAIVFAPVMIFFWGEYCLSREIARLKKDGHPTTWEEFYRKYPSTSSDAPEYKLFQEASTLMPADYDNWLNSRPPEKRGRVAMQDTVDFRSCMYRLLEMPPVRFEREKYKLLPENKVFHFFVYWNMSVIRWR